MFISIHMWRNLPWKPALLPNLYVTISFSVRPRSALIVTPCNTSCNVRCWGRIIRNGSPSFKNMILIFHKLNQRNHCSLLNLFVTFPPLSLSLLLKIEFYMKPSSSLVSVHKPCGRRKCTRTLLW